MNGTLFGRPAVAVRPWLRTAVALAVSGSLGLGAALPADAGTPEPPPRDVPLMQRLQDMLRPSAPAASEVNTAATLKEIVSALRETPPANKESEALTRAGAAMKLAADLDLKQASKVINESLKLDPSNSYLHFFNGFIYHLLAKQGDTAKTDLAIEGYTQAARFDPNNWIASEFLGLGLMEQKQYERAQAAFAEVLLMRPDDPVVLARMLAASYMARDAATACSIADRLGAQPDVDRETFLHAAVSVYGSCGEFDKAQAAQRLFERTPGKADEAREAGRRLGQWEAFHKGRNKAGTLGGAGTLVPTQFNPNSGGFQPADNNQGGFNPNAQPGFNPGAPQGFNPGGQVQQMPVGGGSGTRMVLVDVVMVRTEDSISTSRGINLMSALSLQFGSSSSPAFSRNFTDSGGSSTTVLTRAVTVPALAYSLNLANANTSLNEVLARPTLAAVEGMRSEFFSGTSLNAAVVSSGSVGAGSAVSLEKRYGVKLSVLPQILPGGLIRLTIDASRTFLKPPSANIGFTYKLEISEILANANVVMRMGDTLVLGGLSEKESTTTRDGVPGVQDLPLVQYLFSQQAQTEYQKSVLILITPRPATYTWLSDESRAAAAREAGGEASASIDVLRARYSDWFKPYPNLASVFHHLNLADLYREFRTGDVKLERWDRMDSTRQRLKQALGFLYY
jgi:Flp pilus assembly protein TadD